MNYSLKMIRVSVAHGSREDRRRIWTINIHQDIKRWHGWKQQEVLAPGVPAVWYKGSAHLCSAYYSFSLSSDDWYVTADLTQIIHCHRGQGMLRQRSLEVQGALLNACICLHAVHLTSFQPLARFEGRCRLLNTVIWHTLLGLYRITLT